MLEILKFVKFGLSMRVQEASHAFADEQMLRRKVQSMSDCYVDSAASSIPQVRHAVNFFVH